MSADTIIVVLLTFFNCIMSRREPVADWKMLVSSVGHNSDCVETAMYRYVRSIRVNILTVFVIANNSRRVQCYGRLWNNKYVHIHLLRR